MPRTSNAKTRSITCSATPSSTTSLRAPCSSATSNGSSARAWMVTRDEFGVPGEQELATFVNDERRQFAKLADMIFDVPSFIETVTAYVPLEPGDLLATGTPAGVGIGFNPPRYLQPGDVVRIAISGIGERHRLGLVVGDVDHRRAEGGVQLGEFEPHLHAQLGVE